MSLSREEIIRMAREAGPPEWEIVGLQKEIQRIANAAYAAGAAAEREQCAMVCDAEGDEWASDEQIHDKNYAHHCSNAIRARSGGEK